MIRAGRRMNTDRLREILLLLCFHERGNCILFSRLAGLLTYLEQYLPNWSHIPLHDKESDPPRTCTACGRYGLLLRKTRGIDFQQMVGRCTLTNCLWTSTTWNITQNKSTISPQWKPIQLSRQMQSQIQVEKKTIVMLHLILWSVVLSRHTAVHLFGIYSMYPQTESEIPSPKQTPSLFWYRAASQRENAGKASHSLSLGAAVSWLWDNRKRGRQRSRVVNGNKTPFPYPQLHPTLSESWSLGMVLADLATCNSSQPPATTLPFVFNPPAPTSNSFFFSLATPQCRNK